MTLHFAFLTDAEVHAGLRIRESGWMHAIRYDSRGYTVHRLNRRASPLDIRDIKLKEEA